MTSIAKQRLHKALSGPLVRSFGQSVTVTWKAGARAGESQTFQAILSETPVEIDSDMPRARQDIECTLILPPAGSDGAPLQDLAVGDFIDTAGVAFRIDDVFPDPSGARFALKRRTAEPAENWGTI